MLVQKKDGGLRFYIDLRKSNSHTVKDAYSLSRITETLDCLNGAQWFTSLDLKARYWQVELDEDSKPLTAFTVGPLGFYKCERTLLVDCGTSHVPTTYGDLLKGAPSQAMHYIPG